MTQRPRFDTIPGIPAGLDDGEGNYPVPLERVSVLPPPPDLDPVELVRKAIVVSFSPVIETWSKRSQDMLDVLADSAQARAEVKRGVATIRVCALLGVLALLAGGLAVWASLERDRAERRLVRQLDEQARAAAFAALSDRLARACVRPDERALPPRGRPGGHPGAPGAP